MSGDAIHASLNGLLNMAGLKSVPNETVRITGPQDPLLPTRYKIGQAGTASFAAVGVAASALHALKLGKTQTLEVDTREVVAGLRSSTFLKIDGTVVPHERDPMGGFYQLGNGRWFMLHCSFQHLRDAAARALGVPPTREAATEAFKKYAGDPEALERRVFEAGGCGAFVRTPEEWRKTAQAVALVQVPLFEILKIGDAPPEPLPGGRMPLSGVRVLDLTRVIAGPFCSRMLAEYGADVLRITRPDLPDTGFNYVDNGIGKLSAYIDMRKSDEDARLRDLMRAGDVFVQSYRAGTLAARGYSPKDIAALRPGAIYATLNAWGHGTPWHDRRGYDTVVQSATGMAHTQSSNGKPAFQSVAVLDYVGGAIMALATMAALYRRATEGGSWLVRTSLVGAMQWLTSMGLLEPDDLRSAPPTFSADAIQRLYLDIMSPPIGKITYLRPQVRLSETPALATRPPVPFGYHQAAWPERSN